MKKYLKTPLAVALTLALSACGGGSSSNDTDKAPDKKQGSTPTPPVVTLQTVSLQTSIFQCGNSTPYQTDVVFHDESGTSIGNAKTNADGTFSGEIPQGTKHISVVGDAIDRDDGAYTQIHTQLNIEDRTNLGKVTFVQFKEDCGCETYTVDTSELSYINSGYTLHNGFLSEVTDSLRLCSTEDVYFSVTSPDRSEAKAAVISLTADSKTIKLIDSDFSHQGVEAFHRVSPGSDSQSAAGYIEKINSYRFWQFTTPESLDTLFIFPTITEHNFYRQHYFDSHVANGVEVDIRTHSRSRVNNDGTSENNDLPMPSSNLSFELVNFANSADLSYDFSSVDDRLTRVSWEFSYLVDDEAESRFDWRIDGNITGSIPDLSFGTIFPAPTNEVMVEELNLFLSGYAGNNTDPQTVTQLLEEVAQGGHLTKEKFGKYIYIDMTAKIN